MAVSLDCADCLGFARGQTIPSSREGFARSYEFFISLGHKRGSVGHIEKSILGINGGKNLHDHQPEVVVLTNFVWTTFRVCRVQRGLPPCIHLGAEVFRKKMVQPTLHCYRWRYQGGHQVLDSRLGFSFQSSCKDSQVRREEEGHDQTKGSGVG